MNRVMYFVAGIVTGILGVKLWQMFAKELDKAVAEGKAIVDAATIQPQKPKEPKQPAKVETPKPEVKKPEAAPTVPPQQEVKKEEPKVDQPQVNTEVQELPFTETVYNEGEIVTPDPSEMGTTVVLTKEQSEVIEKNFKSIGAVKASGDDIKDSIMKNSSIKKNGKVD